MIRKMQYASITVTDIEQAKDFYINKLDFRLQVENPIPGGNKFFLVTPKEGGYIFMQNQHFCVLVAALYQNTSRI